MPGSSKKSKCADSEKPVSKATLKLRLLKKLKCTLKYEKLAWAAGAKLVAGVDEVGRGSLFGPVVAAAVILDPGYRIRGLRDSKLLDREQREKLAPRIREHALAWAIAAVDVATIDQINIYWASKRAMEEAVAKLVLRPDHLLIDALRLNCDCAQTPIIHGDALSASIAAASIIAKVERDAMVSAWDPVYPGVRPRLQQRLQHAQSSEGFARERTHAAASAVVRAGVDVVGSAGGAGVHAGGRRSSAGS